MRIKKHKKGSKRGREHAIAARKRDHSGILFMSLGLPSNIVKSVNNRERKAS